MSPCTLLPRRSRHTKNEATFSSLIQLDPFEMVQTKYLRARFHYFPAEVHFRQTLIAETELSLFVVELPLLTEPPFPISLEHRRVLCSYYVTIECNELYHPRFLTS